MCLVGRYSRWDSRRGKLDVGSSPIQCAVAAGNLQCISPPVAADEHQMTITILAMVLMIMTLATIPAMILVTTPAMILITILAMILVMMPVMIPVTTPVMTPTMILVMMPVMVPVMIPAMILVMILAMTPAILRVGNLLEVAIRHQEQ
jgi:hypothetical protein